MTDSTLPEPEVDLIDEALDQMREALSHEDILIAFLLDRSGSMASIRMATIDGFNEFKGEQSKNPGKAWVSLYQFDTSYQTDYEMVAIDKTPFLDESTFVPRGGTALYDGIGHMITSVENSLAQMPEKPGSILCVIMTDGQENSSHELTGPAVKQMIEDKQKAGWDFVYLGANVDAFKEAAKVGIPKGFAAQYASTRASTQAVYAASSSGTTTLRSTARAKGASLTSTGADFFQPDEQDTTDAK